MDIEFFLKDRTKFIRFFYETAIAPFAQVMDDIENEVEPYIPPYSEDGDPPFLSEWIDAKSGVETCGHHALSMLASSLQLYLKALIKRIKRDDAAGPLKAWLCHDAVHYRGVKYPISSRRMNCYI